MTAYNGVERLLSFVIIAYGNVRTDRVEIQNQLGRRRKVSETVVIINNVITLSVTHPVCTRPVYVVQIHNTALVLVHGDW